MNERELALRKRLLATFKVEAEEHVGALGANLVKLENAAPGGAAAEIVEQVFRQAHSLKGAARSVNLVDIERVCQSMESVFAALKKGSIGVSRELLDALLAAVRLLERLQLSIESESQGENPPISPTISALNAALQSAPAPAVAAPVASVPPPAMAAEAVPAPNREPAAAPEPARGSADMVRVPTERLDAVRLQVEEMLSERLVAAQLWEDLQQAHIRLGEWRKRWGRVSEDVRKLARPDETPDSPVARTRDFFEWSKTFVDSFDQQLSALTQTAAQSHRSLTSKTEALLDDSRKLLMLPCSWLFDGLRHVVRDLARTLGKEVELSVVGDAIEVDRRILTELKDPFIHMMRNSLDHGIETPAERENAGKLRRGTIAIRVAQVSGNRIEIKVQDDGRGIDVGRVKESALKTGLLDAEQAERIEPEEALRLVFQSDVTTSRMITDLSGRGLGLAIVREKVELLGGSVSIESRAGVSTSFIMDLPLSLATFRGVVVRLREQYFVLPTVAVERVIRIGSGDIHSIENRETVDVAGQPVAVARLDVLLRIAAGPSSHAADDRVPALVMSSGAARIAFVVDEIMREQEVLVRGLGPHLRRLPNVTGATLLGNGRIALILDGGELIRNAVRLSGTEGAFAASRQDVAPESKSRILIAEDSITSRMLLKSILEAANYHVETAVDGMDALTKLRDGEYDLVVSDVDMPRMNGLALTARIRADKKLEKIPVVLVTSLDSREDRERGIEVGADGYIVKRGFEQNNLLEVIQRLL